MRAPALGNQLRARHDDRCLRSFTGTAKGVHELGGVPGLLRWLVARDSQGLGCADERALMVQMMESAWMSALSNEKQIVRDWEKGAVAEVAEAEKRAARQRELLAARDQERRNARRPSPVIPTGPVPMAAMAEAPGQAPSPLALVGADQADHQGRPLAGAPGLETQALPPQALAGHADHQGLLLADVPSPQPALADAAEAQGHRRRRGGTRCGHRLGMAIDAELAWARAWDLEPPAPMPEFPWQLAQETLAELQACGCRPGDPGPLPRTGQAAGTPGGAHHQPEGIDHQAAEGEPPSQQGLWPGQPERTDLQPLGGAQHQPRSGNPELERLAHADAQGQPQAVVITPEPSALRPGDPRQQPSALELVQAGMALAQALAVPACSRGLVELPRPMAEVLAQALAPAA